jgi:DNA repair protein RadC
MFDVAEVKLIYKSKVPPSQRRKISCSRDAKEIFIENWNDDTLQYYEEFKILLLNRSNSVLGLRCIKKCKL